MKIIVRKSFEKDILKITNKNIAQKILHLIAELEKVETLSDIPHLKKLTAQGNYFSIREGNFRIGFKLEQDTVILLRGMDRKEIYKFFP